MSRILAIDYGRKRIGLALSDELGATAQPLGHGCTVDDRVAAGVDDVVTRGCYAGQYG